MSKSIWDIFNRNHAVFTLTSAFLMALRISALKSARWGRVGLSAEYPFKGFWCHV